MSRYYRLRREGTLGKWHIEAEVAVGQQSAFHSGGLGIDWAVYGNNGPNELTLHIGPFIAWVGLFVMVREPFAPVGASQDTEKVG